MQGQKPDFSSERISDAHFYIFHVFNFKARFNVEVNALISINKFSLR